MKKKTNYLIIFVICVLVFVTIFFISKIIMAILSSRLSEEEIETFNGEIVAYEGENNGDKVKELLEKVVASNEKKENKERQIALKADHIVDTQSNQLMLGETEGKKIELKNTNLLQKNKTYIVKFEYGSNKLVKTVKVSLQI